MAVERTLSIIKPDAVGKNVIGQIISRFEAAGLTVVAAKMVHLSDNLAGGFYAEHRERPFYPDLVSFMTSGPVIVQVLEGEDAIARNRELMGATNPQEADAGTIERISRSRLMPMPCTARTRRLQQSARSPISSRRARSAHADPRPALTS